MNEKWVDNFAKENRAEDKRMAKESRREAKAERAEAKREKREERQWLNSFEDTKEPRFCEICNSPLKTRKKYCSKCRPYGYKSPKGEDYSNNDKTIKIVNPQINNIYNLNSNKQEKELMKLADEEIKKENEKINKENLQTRLDELIYLKKCRIVGDDLDELTKKKNIQTEFQSLLNKLSFWKKMQKSDEGFQDNPLFRRTKKHIEREKRRIQEIEEKLTILKEEGEKLGIFFEDIPGSFEELVHEIDTEEKGSIWKRIFGKKKDDFDEE